MTTDTVPQTVLFPDLFDKPLFARFNQEQASSDGGAILLKAAERIYGLVKAFAGCLFDKLCGHAHELRPGVLQLFEADCDRVQVPNVGRLFPVQACTVPLHAVLSRLGPGPRVLRVRFLG